MPLEILVNFVIINISTSSVRASANLFSKAFIIINTSTSSMRALANLFSKALVKSIIIDILVFSMKASIL